MHFTGCNLKKEEKRLSWRLSVQQQLHHNYIICYYYKQIKQYCIFQRSKNNHNNCTINYKPSNVREFSKPSGDGLIMMDMQTVKMWQSLWICQTYHSLGNTRYNLKTCLTAQSRLFYESSWLKYYHFWKWRRRKRRRQRRMERIGRTKSTLATPKNDRQPFMQVGFSYILDGHKCTMSRSSLSKLLQQAGFRDNFLGSTGSQGCRRKLTSRRCWGTKKLGGTEIQWIHKVDQAILCS